jgi:hypothetical protein
MRCSCRTLPRLILFGINTHKFHTLIHKIMDANLSKFEKGFIRVLEGAICVFYTIMAVIFALGAILAFFTTSDGIVTFVGTFGFAAAAFVCWQMRRV